MSGRVWRLVIAAALFLGWMGWLGYAALSKSRGPIVSRAQAAVATDPVVARVERAEDGAPSVKVRVVEPLTKDGPAKDSEIMVANMPDVEGFQGPGEYLLLLTKDRTTGGYYVPRWQRSPGYEMGDAGKPTIYPWTDHVRAQARALFP